MSLPTAASLAFQRRQAAKGLSDFSVELCFIAVLVIALIVTGLHIF